MSQYLMSVWHDDNYVVDFTGEEAQQAAARVGAYNEELMSAGAWVFGGGLHPASSATALRPSGGDVSMTDGPYAETKEMVAGFYLIEARDLNEAIVVASRLPSGPLGTVEVRPCRNLEVGGVPHLASSKPR